MLWSVSTGASEPNQLNTPQDCDPDYAGDGGSLRRQQFRATTLTGPFPKRPMPEAIHPCCSLSHTEPGILHLSRQTTHRRNSLKKKRGRRGGSKQLLGFRGEDLKARESNVFWDRKRNDPSRARRQRPTRRDDSRKDLKMAPVGEESRSETAQQTLAGSQAAPSSPRSPTPTRTESCTAKAGRRARARPEPPPEELSLLPQILFRSVLPSPEEEGSGEQRIEEKQRPPPLSPSPSGNLVTVLSKYKRALYT